MKITTLTKRKNELKLKFDEIDQGFLNMIKDRLWKDKATDVAGFRIDHPQVGHPTFILKTKGKDAKKVWNDSLDSLQKDLKGFNKELKKVK